MRRALELCIGDDTLVYVPGKTVVRSTSSQYERKNVRANSSGNSVQRLGPDVVRFHINVPRRNTFGDSRKDPNGMQYLVWGGDQWFATIYDLQDPDHDVLTTPFVPDHYLRCRLLEGFGLTRDDMLRSSLDVLDVLSMSPNNLESLASRKETSIPQTAA